MDIFCQAFNNMFHHPLSFQWLSSDLHLQYLRAHWSRTEIQSFSVEKYAMVQRNLNRGEIDWGSKQGFKLSAFYTYASVIVYAEPEVHEGEYNEEEFEDGEFEDIVSTGRFLIC